MSVPVSNITHASPVSHKVKLKLLAIVLAAACLTQIGVTFLLTITSINTSEREFRERTAALINSRAQIIGSLIWRFQYDELQRVVEDVMLDSPVASVRIFDPSGKLLQTYGGIENNEVRLDVMSIPLLYRDGIVRADAGRLEVTIARNSVLFEYSARLMEAAMLALFSAAAIIVAIWTAMTKLINRPLGLLLDAIERSQNNNERVRVEWQGNDEIGTVIQAFNAMQRANDSARQDVLSANRKLKFLSEQDELTGLPNRRAAQNCVKSLKPGSLAVHFIDLDEFKSVNDTFGHGAGDLLLSSIGKVLSKITTDDAQFFRMGGDEFIALQTNVHSAADALEFAQNIHQLLARSYSLGNNQYSLRLSTGTFFTEEGIGDSDEFFGLADIALYEAKRQGRNRVVLLTDEMRRMSDEKHMLEKDVAAAIRNGDIEPHFQPQLDVRTGEVVGFEALSRWLHPIHGPIPPDRFIPIIESMGLAVEHGNLILRRSCEALVLLQTILGRRYNVAVNVSADQLLSPNFVAATLQETSRNELPPCSIEIEITESELVQNFEQADVVIRNLRSAGLTVAIDDFGTGYSSLSYLTRLPVDRIKIDKSFISQITTDKSAHAVVELVANVAQTLSLSVVAEGVEKEEEELIIRDFGIQFAQGFRFAKGMPLPILIEFMREHLHQRTLAEGGNLISFKRRPS